MTSTSDGDIGRLFVLLTSQTGRTSRNGPTIVKRSCGEALAQHIQIKEYLICKSGSMQIQNGVLLCYNTVIKEQEW